MHAPAEPPTQADPSTNVRSVVSLLIAVHLLAVGIALLCSVQRSVLQTRLSAVLAPYARTLYFVPHENPFLYTYGNTRLGDNDDDDHIVQIDIPANPKTGSAATTVEFPAPGSNWSPNRQRAFELTHRLGWYAEQDADDQLGVLMQEIAWQPMKQYGVDEVEVHCIRRMTQPFSLDDLPADFPRDNPASPKYERDLYSAQIYLVDGQLQVAKKSASREVAPRAKNSGGADGQ